MNLMNLCFFSNVRPYIKVSAVFLVCVSTWLNVLFYLRMGLSYSSHLCLDIHPPWISWKPDRPVELLYAAVPGSTWGSVAQAAPKSPALYNQMFSASSTFPSKRLGLEQTLSYFWKYFTLIDGTWSNSFQGELLKALSCSVFRLYACVSGRSPALARAWERNQSFCTYTPFKNVHLFL